MNYTAALLALALLPLPLKAEVYRCMKAGKPVYTDQRCSQDAQPASLPPLNLAKGTPGEDLAKAHDERIARGKKARDAADAVFIEQHRARKAHEEAVRAAIIDHRVIAGMTESEIESATRGGGAKSLPAETRYSDRGPRKKKPKTRK